jgi:hypothetical protein
MSPDKTSYGCGKFGRIYTLFSLHKIVLIAIQLYSSIGCIPLHCSDSRITARPHASNDRSGKCGASENVGRGSLHCTDGEGYKRAKDTLKPEWRIGRPFSQAGFARVC